MICPAVPCVLVKVNSADVQEYLTVLMDQEFNTIVEDGSLKPVSMRMWCVYFDCVFICMDFVSRYCKFLRD